LAEYNSDITLFHFVAVQLSPKAVQSRGMRGRYRGHRDKQVRGVTYHRILLESVPDGGESALDQLPDEPSRERDRSTGHK
jgi:hypothetical protein